MKKGDVVWGGLFLCWVLILAIPESRQVFIDITKAHPYFIGFIKFAMLATMGEFLTLRILNGKWVVPALPLARAVIWGFLGAVIVLVFDVFSTGVNGALEKGLLLVPASKFAGAFCTSAVMNITFAPTMMGFHRLTDTYLDLLAKSNQAKPKLAEVVRNVNWHNYISFVCLKTIPIFWIPAHTVTFLLPPVFRVIAAAFLSIVLGLMLTFAKRRCHLGPKAVAA
ncbi:hypothetical protein [Candidatus Formimonas warabiya]|uniref:hypothetical protein n=1 Tax=Formimonas warabiya TaxID=1761012 RepID=UPI0011D0A6D8|nr:hypothetical protein [Candidatus Formimonas warabiya]